MHLLQSWAGRKLTPPTLRYCQARLRLPEKLLQKLLLMSGEKLEEKCTLEQLWCGRYVKIIDTSTVTMADTEENQLCYPQSSSQKEGCGFPIAKIAVIFSLATGALVSCLIDVLNVGDVKLARLLYDFLNPEDVLLGDRASLTKLGGTEADTAHFALLLIC
ncbi:putative transposase, IS4 family [Calothrix sp. NIES-4071]|nr:putative transposase, IS4 family [Calothrix sp. NIES-4071]BAZ61044.1 putative transposase, IS4 family [Calothrix sp. NIES-4105]